jgi:Fur family transcriptional regulator, ferric uptake regulator
MENFLRSKKLRVTPFRVAVLEVFSRHKNAVDIDQIEKSLKEFDRITLYRTVRTFIEKGLIHEIVMPGDIKKLALCKDECSGAGQEHHHQHLHFKCDICEEVYCLELVHFPEIKYPKFKIIHLEIQGSGVCQSCR